MEVTIPLAPRWIQVTHDPGHILRFDGSLTMPTLNAGYTYRFLMADVEWLDQATSTALASDDILSFTSDGATEYTTGITRSGAVGSAFAYVEFAVPSDVPPLQWYNDAHETPATASNAVTISGSTYVVPVSGITLEGPVANQTGSNLFDAGDHGWLSIDEPLGAGERLVLDGAFLADLVDAMPDSSVVAIGLKDASWANTQVASDLDFAATAQSVFEGGTFLRVERNSTADVRFTIYSYATGANSSQYNTTLADVTSGNVDAALEVSSSGNNIRVMLGTPNNSADVASTTAYADWYASYKEQTGNQGYGITSLDVMVLGDDGGTAGMDSADVDWTGLSELAVPTAAATLTTPWSKALDFSGGSEYTSQINSSYLYTPLNLGNVATTVAAPGTAGDTSSDSNARPWATSIVFSSDNNASNQHVWNCGEGAGSTDDNIYLRQDASRNLYFGWGRDGGLNECLLTTLSATAGTWNGLYIAHNGTRLSGANASAANLAAAFDIRLVDLSSGAVGSQLSTSTNWTAGSTGGRMDRQFIGTMAIGGRGANRNFHGKMGAMVVSTLRLGVAMPAAAEVSMMVRDPLQWLTDYKVGNAYRRPSAGTDTAGFSIGGFDASYGTQVWLMGDGTSDAFAVIRNQVYPSEQNRTPMRMNNMVSGDLETVNISGLT